MNYEIIATLGPSSNTHQVWEEMLSAGVNGFRLNTSHLSLLQLQEWLAELISFCSSRDIHPYLVLDLQGSKWRIGEIESFELVADNEVELVLASSTDRQGVIPVPHQDFFEAIPISSSEAVLNDAKIRLAVIKAGPDWVRARVVQGGMISRNKGITFTSSNFRMETLSAKDQTIIEQTRDLPSIRYALSYLKDSAEAHKYRAFIGDSAYLIAKLERPTAIEGAIKIAALVNELWLCRGDLGAEVGLKAMGETVHQFSSRVQDFAVPVFMAGQVLEHLVDHATPTRSEVCFIYDTLVQGYKGLVLSDETAVGHNIIEGCRIAALYKDLM